MDDSGWVKKTVRAVAEELAQEMAAVGFQGRAGIDCMVVRLASGDLALRVPLELNARATMGHVALALRKPLTNRAVGVWLFVTRADLKGTAYDGFPSLVRGLEAALPEAHEAGQMVRGVFCTQDATQVEGVLSLGVVAPTLGLVKTALRTVGLEHLAAEEIG